MTEVCKQRARNLRGDRQGKPRCLSSAAPISLHRCSCNFCSRRSSGSATKARFGHGEQRAGFSRSQPEFDQRLRLASVVGLVVLLGQRFGLRPGERSEFLLDHLFNVRFPYNVLAAGMENVPANRCSHKKRLGERNTEPLRQIRGNQLMLARHAPRAPSAQSVFQFCRRPKCHLLVAY